MRKLTAIRPALLLYVNLISSDQQRQAHRRDARGHSQRFIIDNSENDGRQLMLIFLVRRRFKDGHLAPIVPFQLQGSLPMPSCSKMRSAKTIYAVQ